MGSIATSIAEALRLLFGGDPAVWEIIGVSLVVSSTAVLIGAVLGIPLGYLLGVSRSRLGRVANVLVNTGMSLPPVVAGLLVFVMLSRSGPLGSLGLLFSRPAMIVAQVVIATPLVAGVTAAAVSSVPRDVRLQARSLGANRVQEALFTLSESRRGVMAAVIAGFGGIISEVGAVMMVGGNIQHSTRVMTTAIVLETRQGHFGAAVALAMILLGIAFMINAGLTTFQHAGARYER